ncbi:MAG: CBS domain-containing protein [Halanaerobium sp.]|nr:CBS domain-containing protein [Halanaerobium sp.]
MKLLSERLNSLESRILRVFTYNLKVNDIMTRDVYTLSPKESIIAAKQMMKEKKISGVPVVDLDNRVVGIISIDDIITALETGNMMSPVEEIMTDKVFFLYDTQPVIQAMRLFRKNKVGRFPVVNRQGILVGILTPGDIAVKVLKQIEEFIDEEALEVGKIFKYGGDIPEKFKEPGPGEKFYRFFVGGGDFDLAGQASSRIKEILREAGYSSQLLRKASVISFEGEMNIVIHAYKGWIYLFVGSDKARLFFEDEGPGISDIELALQPGFTTASEKIREMGFGAGMGLCNIQRWADQLMIESELNVGTRIAVILHEIVDNKNGV